MSVTLINRPQRWTSDFSGILLKHIGEIVTAQDRERFKEYTKQHESFLRQLDKVSDGSARSQIRTLQDKYNADPSEKNLAALQATRLNRARLEEEHRAVRHEIKRAFKEFTLNKVYPFAIAIWERALPFAEKRADEIEALERAHAGELKIPFEASETLCGLRWGIKEKREALQKMRESQSPCAEAPATSVGLFFQ